MTSGGFTAFQTEPGRHPGLSPQLDDLHSQFDAYPETQVCPDGGHALAKAARNWIARAFETSRRSAQRRHGHQNSQPSLLNQTAIPRRPRPARCRSWLVLATDERAQSLDSDSRSTPSSELPRPNRATSPLITLFRNRFQNLLEPCFMIAFLHRRSLESDGGSL